MENAKGNIRHETFDVLLRCVREHHRCVDRLLTMEGIKLQRLEFSVLHELYRGGKAASQKELAQRFGTSQALIARTLKVLQEKEFIISHSDDRDRRRNGVAISPKGEEIVRDSIQTFEHAEEAAFVGFAPEELAQLKALIERMHENVTAMEHSLALKERGR